METISPKIVAAISTAVKAYQDDQRVSYESLPQLLTVPSMERISLWAIAGRQEAMLQRKIWQLRLY
ncbi:MAG: hypothetical protein N2511_06135 [Thermodesulfovibrionales bacterium]|nr:hypothetical protein [Thermodesulfovibrionales bacterium]